MTSAFEFKQCITMLKATGKKAGSLREFRNALAAVSGGSIFHHTCQYFLKGHILEYTNDFAHWAGESIEERALAEHLSNIDPYDFSDIENVRKALVTAVDEYLERFPEPRLAIPGDDFFFNETVTLIFSAGMRARNPAEFLMAIKYVDRSSLYYHFYEARTRLGNKDDFSVWFETVLGKQALADTIRAIDPFMHSLEEIRERLVRAVETEVQKEIEFAGAEA